MIPVDLRYIICFMQEQNSEQNKGKTSKRELLDKTVLLAKKINELALKIQGTQLEVLINKLYEELELIGVKFKPKCYLTDEWGCPHGIPVIGIPFYLSDPNLKKLEGELTGVDAENDEEAMMFLRHEAGHAFNYAYRLYRKKKWRSIFGLFSTPYREIYRPKPFDPKFVRNIPGWYGQKHPDEDFAETFAVILTPNSNWKVKYRKTPALKKLNFVAKMIRKYGTKDPLINTEQFDTPLSELTETLKEWYTIYPNGLSKKLKLPQVVNEDLKNLFVTYNKEKAQIPAGHFFKIHFSILSFAINSWTGIDTEVVDFLLQKLSKKARRFKLYVNEEEEKMTIVKLTSFATTLIANYLYTGNFVSL